MLKFINWLHIETREILVVLQFLAEWIISLPSVIQLAW